MYAKYEVSNSYGSKVIKKVNVDNRQTGKQTDREDKTCFVVFEYIHSTEMGTWGDADLFRETWCQGDSNSVVKYFTWKYIPKQNKYGK